MESPPSANPTPVTGGPDSESGQTDAGPLRRVRFVARLMDDIFRIPGTNIRFGLDPILGVIPGLGSAAAAVVSLYIVLEAVRAGVPRTTVLRMLALVAVDTVAGSVPFVGPLFDAVWKANVWNVATLERHVEADHR